MPHYEWRLPTYSSRSGALARAVVRPVQRFMRIEASGGIVLLLATVAALIWANSPWQESYHQLWETHLTVQIGNLITIDEPLEAWVNDLLMAVFFFVVGLEIKRELVTGELQDRRAAILPGVAALGGMLVPALIFLAFTLGREGSNGWGIPMATDIAFAVGVVALLGSRVPGALKVFLLTLAIVDDIGAIAVIAIFYTESLSFGWLAVATALIATTFALRRARVWYLPLYVVLAGAVWLAVFESGVHATIAGVVLGLITPAEPLVRLNRGDVDEILDDTATTEAERAREASRMVTESVPVGERLEHALHPWSTYVVIPIFALANAGIELSSEIIRAAITAPVTLGIFFGLVVGKVVGVFGMTMLTARAGISPMPRGARAGHIAGIGSVAGIGFTVALFITALAFDDPVLRDEAKIGVLAASIVAALIGAAVLRAQTPVPDAETDQ